MNPIRDVRLHDQILIRAKQLAGSCEPADHEERLLAHEKRIHNHPCECGSGKRYVDCCIDKRDQEKIELRHRLRMAARQHRRARLKPTSAGEVAA